MKKTIIIILCSIITLQITARDVISSSRTTYAIGKKRTPTTSVIKINTLSKVNALKIKIENQTQQEQFTPAFIKAAKLLTEGVSEDYPLTIQIMYGSPNEFIPSTGTTDLLAITTTNFVLNNYGYRNPNTSNPTRDRNGNNKLIPQAIANREYLADTDPSTPDMVIKLNPDPSINFYTDTLNTNIADDQYDLTTVILREMVTGCGFISSIRRNEENLYYKTTASNNYEYPFLFDTYLVNDKGASFTDVANNTSSILSFLTGNQVYFNVSGSNIATIFNELAFFEGVTNFTARSLNKTFDANNQDLMTSEFSAGQVIRELTPTTKNILQELGWQNDIITSLRYNRCGIIFKDNSYFVDMNGVVNTTDNPNATFILQPNTSYTFTINANSYIETGEQFFGLQLVKSNGEYYTLAQSSITKLLPISYSSLPNYEWQRDPSTGAIIGYIFFSSHNPGYDPRVFASDFYFSGYRKVLLPYVPAPPIIGVSKMNTTSTATDALVSYSSQGATSYKINYTTSGDPTQHVINKANKEDLTCLLNSLPLNRKTSIYVTAQNANGSVNSSTVTVGEDPYSSMAMIVTKVGTTLKYQFKLGTEYVTNLTINSAAIYDTNGNFKMTVNAGINQTFSIASLASGYYVLKVNVANSTVFSKIFFK